MAQNRKTQRSHTISGGLLSRARLGDTDALTQSLNYIFSNKGVSIKVALNNALLEVIITHPSLIQDKAKIIIGIQHYIKLLGKPIFSSVIIYSKRQKNKQLDWWYEITLDQSHNIINSITSSLEVPIHKNLTAGSAIAETMQPPPVIKFSDLDPQTQESIRRAGGRGIRRSDPEAQRVYEKMPENTRRNLADIKQYRSDHDWSHKKAYKNGGSHATSNGDWEAKSLNRSRGGRDITPQEEAAIKAAKAKINFQSGASIVGRQMFKAGGIAFGIELAFSGLENFVAVQRGDKDFDAALSDTIKNSASVAITAACITGGIVALTLVFPPMTGVIGTATPFLQIVGGVACLQRVANLLENSPRLDGIERLEMLLAVYGIDQTEMTFQLLEIDYELSQLRSQLT